MTQVATEGPSPLPVDGASHCPGWSHSTPSVFCDLPTQTLFMIMTRSLQMLRCRALEHEIERKVGWASGSRRPHSQCLTHSVPSPAPQVACGPGLLSYQDKRLCFLPGLGASEKKLEQDATVLITKSLGLRSAVLLPRVFCQLFTPGYLRT